MMVLVDAFPREEDDRETDDKILPMLRYFLRKKEKAALLVGTNYPGQEGELYGCINDVKGMTGQLVKYCGFSEEDITLLIDSNPPSTQPTADNIRTFLNSLIRSQKESGVEHVLFYFSGHGRWCETEKTITNSTGYGKSIVSVDRQSITGTEIRQFVDQVPNGCQITIISDSCYSGALLDGAKEQIGDSTEMEIKNRCICDEFITDGFASWTTKIYMESREESIAGPSEGNLPSCGILISASQSDQQAKERPVKVGTENGDLTFGVLTNALLAAIEETKGDVTNRALVRKVRENLLTPPFIQNSGLYCKVCSCVQKPGLYCNDGDADAPFLSVSGVTGKSQFPIRIP